MRDPALHIGKQDFILVLEKIGIPNAEQVANQVYDAAVPYHIKSRYLVTGDAKTRQKVTRIVESANIAEISVETFNGLLNNLRQAKGAQYIQKLNKGSAEWTQLREILLEAHSFVQTFGFDPVIEGYKTFLSLGLKLMGRDYRLNKFKYYTGKIHQQYESEMVLDMDATPEDTIMFWELWKVAMLEHAGTEPDIVVPEKMVHMIYGKQEADESKAEYADWIEAQFEGLAFLSVVPELSQFYGPNAKNRYEKFMLNNKGTVKREKKRIDEKENEAYNLPSSMSDEQIAYFAALRAKSAGK